MFLIGVKHFFVSTYQLFTHKELLSWFFKVCRRSFFLSIFIIFAFFLLLNWGAWSYLLGWIASQGWALAAGALATVLLFAFIVYFSAAITSILMNSFVGFFLSEEKLLKVLHPNLKGQKLSIKNRWLEYRAMLRTLLITILSFPMFLIPILLPLGVLLVAWAMGKEYITLSKRIFQEHQIQFSTYESFSFCAGLAFFPALFLLIPLIGWVGVPLLLQSCFRLAEQKNP